MAKRTKVNLTEMEYEAVIEDMLKYGFVHKNGEVNKNDFYNTLMVNMYTDNFTRRNKFKKLLQKEEILKDIPDRDKAIDVLSKVMNSCYFEDSRKRHKESITFSPTKATRRIFDFISSSELKSRDGSAFARSITNEYLSLPPSDRERLLRKDMYNNLCVICETGHHITCHVSGHECNIIPYALVPSKEMACYYLLGFDLDSRDMNPVSIRMSKIDRVITHDDYHEFTEEEVTRLEEIIKTGVQYASGEILKVKIKVTDEGRRMLDYKHYNKPETKSLKNNVYEVTCTLSNFLNYFCQFGREMAILDNDDLKERMRKFYKEAYEAYYQG